MYQIRKILIYFALTFFVQTPSQANRFLETFANMPIILDAQVESPTNFDNVRTMPLPQPGDQISIQVFVPQSAGLKSFGFDITSGISGKNISDYLSLPSGTAFDGSSLSPTSGIHTTTALLISQPAFPNNGFWATVQFQIIGALAEGDVLYVTEGFAGDVNTDKDPLNVSSASIVFSDTIEPIKGDIDLDGDVDFTDFLTFAGNFGKKGPVPSSNPTNTPSVITVFDTTVITQKDTVFLVKADTIEVVVRDTVTIQSNQSTYQDTVIVYVQELAPPPSSNLNVIPGLTSISALGIRRNWDADAEEDGIEYSITYRDANGDALYFDFEYTQPDLYKRRGLQVTVTLNIYRQVYDNGASPAELVTTKTIIGTIIDLSDIKIAKEDLEPYWSDGRDFYTNIAVTTPAQGVFETIDIYGLKEQTPENQFK